jgi:hypothetical protein
MSGVRGARSDGERSRLSRVTVALRDAGVCAGEMPARTFAEFR